MVISAVESQHVIPLPRGASPARAVSPVSSAIDHAELEALTDEELIVRSRHREGDAARDCLAILYRRHYAKVARWCLRVCGDSDRAADAAQEVFLRVHERLDTFRVESRFSTWLFTLTRRVAIDRSVAASRLGSLTVDSERQAELQSQEQAIDEATAGAEIAARLRRAIRRDLEPLEARVLYLHHVHGLSLPTITEHLGLTNKSGAKAHLVAARRKLRRRFGRWLDSQSSERSRT